MRLVDHAAPARHRRDPRLGAVALPERRRTAWPASTAPTCYEHADPRQGFHPDWKSAIFNYGRHEVRSFLISSALVVARPLPRRRPPGRRRRLDALPRLLPPGRASGSRTATAAGRTSRRSSSCGSSTTRCTREHPGTTTFAEESTSWPMVTPADVRRRARLRLQVGHGVDARHPRTTCSRDPVHRRYHHHELTFRSVYASSENFVLPLSHDEVVHGKGSLLGKMPGDRWQQRANLRLLYAWQWAQPGKKLLFMGGELAQYARVGPRRDARVVAPRRPGHGRRPVAGCATSTRSTPPSRRCTAATATPTASGGSRPTTSTNSVYAFLRLEPRRARRAPGAGRRQRHPGRPPQLPRRRARRRAVARGAEQRRAELRRQRRRQPRRRSPPRRCRATASSRASTSPCRRSAPCSWFQNVSRRWSRRERSCRAADRRRGGRAGPTSHRCPPGSPPARSRAWSCPGRCSAGR